MKEELVKWKRVSPVTFRLGKTLVNLKLGNVYPSGFPIINQLEKRGAGANAFAQISIFPKTPKCRKKAESLFRFVYKEWCKLASLATVSVFRGFERTSRYNDWFCIQIVTREVAGADEKKHDMEVTVRELEDLVRRWKKKSKKRKC